MNLAIHLLGRPQLARTTGPSYRFRSRKSWALLAYLVLSERPPSRAQLASQLFAEAADPLRALRWSLAEIRRGLGEDGSIDGDPVVLRLRAGTLVDVNVVARGSWVDAVALPALGEELLEAFSVPDSPAFESWLLSAQRRVAASTEAILHEAALGSLSRGDLHIALDYAVHAATMSPLDENHQALVIRIHRLVGDDDSAVGQYEAWATRLHRELGVRPGPVVEAALRERRHLPRAMADRASVEAIIEAGSAAVAAGASDAGIHSLRTAVRMADAAGKPDVQVRARWVLAEALIHSLRGYDEEGLAVLYEADDIALAHDIPEAAAQARAEIGYVDFLRARYDRAEVWLTRALELAGESVSLQAKIMTYLGSVESDRANYASAVTLLQDAVALSRSGHEPRRESYGLSMLGRVSLLHDNLDLAADQLDAAIGLAEREHWLAFLPWPQVLRGEVQLSRRDTTGADQRLQQAFARACQLGDPCWEGMCSRALALLAESTGETEQAFALLADARARSNRLADPYVWLDGYILDAQCTLGRRHGHADTPAFIDTLTELASRNGMRELRARALVHDAHLRGVGTTESAALLAADIDNPSLRRLVDTEHDCPA